MKSLSLALLGIVLVGMGILSGLAYSHFRSKPPEVAPAQSETSAQSNQPAEPPPAVEPARVVAQPSQAAAAVRVAAPSVSPASAVSNMPMNVHLDKSIIGQAVDTLVSPQATYGQRQAIWKQLQDSGKFDQAITDLEQRAISDPRSPETAAALGQAYLKKCGMLKDVREQGILAMQADKAFDTALSLDPANWDARFTKAVALSYWPPNMNKGDECIQHFETLIEQQEVQQPQPQFAATYAWLGEQYKKAGRMEDARAMWQRGSGLFPNNPELRMKLAPAQ